MDTLSAARWMTYNTVLGGPAQFYSRLAYGTWGNCDALLAIKHYLVWDTQAAAQPAAFPVRRRGGVRVAAVRACACVQGMCRGEICGKCVFGFGAHL